MLCLEYLVVEENLVRGTGMNSETVDGILNFFVSYDMFVLKKQDDLPLMEEVSEEISVKG